MSDVNEQLLDAVKHCHGIFDQYVSHHLAKPDYDKAAANERHRAICAEAIAAAEQAQQVEPVALDDAAIIGIAKPYRQEVCHIDVYSFNKREFLDVARRIIDAAQPPAVAVPDGVARAIEAVAAAIYFADSSDYLSTLWDTLRFLSPEIAAIAESDTRAAWERAELARTMLAAAPQAVATGWIDPNDKTQKQYLPHIGEPVLFCHGGVTYYGVHTGGSFKAGHGVTARLFGTWDCLWMYPPTAAAQKGGA